MRVLIATDAWHPQVNGVVRTLTSLAKSARGLSVGIEFLTPEGFPSVPVPTYPGLRFALPSGREIARRIAQIEPRNPGLTQPCGASTPPPPSPWWRRCR